MCRLSAMLPAVFLLVTGLVLGTIAHTQPVPAASQALGRLVEPGPTGWAVRRPVLASACAHGCPFGELGDYIADAMRPLGYDVILCRNCNSIKGPPLVARHDRPPLLTPQDIAMGTTDRVDAPVDFGITLSWLGDAAYRGSGPYAKLGPQRDLRLIARIEDPMYLLVAVRKDLGIIDLADIRDRHLPVRILASGVLAHQVLEYYGLTPDLLAAQGGTLGAISSAPRDAPVDIMLSDLASPANNMESSAWTTFSQMHDISFLRLPEALLSTLAKEPGVERVTARWGLLRGLDGPIPTVGTSGEVVFARADTPDAAAYALARAIDLNRAGLRWYVRPYSYDPRTVAKDLSLPLHPGAARWYHIAGYSVGDR